MLSPFAALVSAFFLVVPGDGQCEWGKYGEHCNVTCHPNCALVPPRNLQHCDRDTGKCSAGCRRGWHGDVCDQECSRNCLNKTCNHQTGHCTLGCNGSYIGDFCNRTRECGRGFHGDTCEHPCSRTCVEERCNQTTGVCVHGCNGTYTGEFCNITKVRNVEEEADNLAAILVPVFLIAAAVAAVIVVLLWRRWRRWRRRKSSAQSAEDAADGETPLILRMNEESEATEETTLLQTGIMSEDLLQQEMKQAEDVFEKTDIYYRVKKELEVHRHVTMSGTVGGGKKTVALMLGKHYKDKGYKVFLVTDVCKINLNNCLSGDEKVFFIFHDIFKPVEFPRDKPQVDRILRELEHKLEACKSRSGDNTELYAILTANTSKVQGDTSQFCGTFFSGSSFIDFTLSSCQNSRKEKKEIFQKHCKASHQDDLKDLDVDVICGFKESVFGFPQICKLFFAFQKFRKHGEKFFREPFHYLWEELEAILRQMNDDAGALILMFLCNDKLNLREVEVKSDNQDLENMLTLIEDIVCISSRTQLAKSIRQFSGTFFTKGDITGFAHPSIYDACGCAIFTVNPSCVLEYCHMKFLRDYVRHDQHLVTSTVDKNQPTIHVSDVYASVVEKRRASDIRSEELSNAGVRNDGVRRKEWLDKQMTKTEKVFVKTGIYDRVKKMLETHGHVTMSGAAGGGKTAIALMLGKQYEEEQGFLQVHVADVSKFKLDVYTHELRDRGVCFIFHDIFRIIEPSTDIADLKNVLLQLIECKKKLIQKHKLLIILTTNTYSDHGQISQLGNEGAYFFSGPSFFDLNEMSCQYTDDEKSRIFNKICKGFDETVDVRRICGFDQSILGFPQTCKLFVGFQSFQNHKDDFFQRPFHYLKEEVNSVLEGGNDQSAALILMFLRDGSLNLHQVELPSDNKDLEALFTTLKSVVRFTTRTGVAMAVRQFIGSFFTKGDITEFAHPSIYDACAIALYKDHRALVLKHASIRFLCEHVRTKETEDTIPETMVYVPKTYIEELKKRLFKLKPEHPNYAALKALIEK